MSHWNVCSRRGVAFVMLLAPGILELGCTDGGLVAPIGSVITVSVSPTTIAVGGDTATVSLLVREQDGTKVPDNTQVEIVATNGGLCAIPVPSPIAPACAVWPGIVTVATKDGVASALIRSSESPGAIALDIHSGSATAIGSLVSSARVASDGGKIILQPSRDTIAVGDTDRIILFVSTADGIQATNGTRVVLTTPDNSLSRLITVTRDGFAETLLTGVKAGAAIVTAMSGTVKAQRTIVVK